MAMLKASHLPTAIGIVHCRSHQTGDSIVSKRNNRLDEAARAAALSSLDLSHPPQDIHTQLESSLSLPNTHQSQSYLHQLFHPNSQALSSFIKTYLQPTPEDLSFLKSITVSCKICQMSDSNSRYYSTTFPTHQARGSLPGTDWQLDFTHRPTIRLAKYLLVLVDTFSVWVEAFPTTNKRAQTVSDILLCRNHSLILCLILSPVKQWS